jgi:hypothetical protein
MRIIKRQYDCPTISPSSKATLAYDINHDKESNSLSIRIIANSGGGFFSNEWIAINDILACIEKAPADFPFKALIFRHLYKSKGSNNHGFLAAVLRNEGLLVSVPKAAYSHAVGDHDAFNKAVQKLVKGKTNLEDIVAIREAEIEAKREALAKKMKAAAKSPEKLKN